MLRLTYDPIFGVTVLYASGLEPCPVDRVVVADEGGDCSLTDPPSAKALSRTVEAGGQANCAAEGDPHSGD